jgi:hypothetical protein
VRDALAAATPYLRLFATVAGGWLLARQALAVRARGDTTEWGAAKLTSARYFVTQVVPTATGLLAAIEAGAAEIDALPASAF